jgi:hypothetical protein
MSHQMTTIKTIQNVSLAIALGGPIFAKIGLPAAAKELSSDAERGKMYEKAWDAFTGVNLAAHLGFATAWGAGRHILRAHRLDARSEKLIRVKDILVRGALITGVSNAIVGKLMKAQFPDGVHISQEGMATGKDAEKVRAFGRYFRVMGTLNLAFIAGVFIVDPILTRSVIKHFKGHRSLLSRLLRG